jgi:hypothetical protein
MRYEEFREAIRRGLAGRPNGFTWKELRERLSLPYERPCPTWVARLEREIGLVRARGESAAHVWSVPGSPARTSARVRRAASPRSV